MYRFRYLGIAILFIFMLPVIPLDIGTSVSAQPDLNGLLNGTYRATIHRSCIQTEDGFVNRRLTGDGWTNTLASWGTWRFYGNGMGDLAGNALNIRHDATAIGDRPAVNVVFNCPLTYTVSPDRSFEANLILCTGQIFPPSGPALTIAGIRVRGQIDQTGRTLLLNDTSRNIETLTVATTPNPTTTNRICNRSGTAVKIGGGRGRGK